MILIKFDSDINKEQYRNYRSIQNSKFKYQRLMPKYNLIYVRVYNYSISHIITNNYYTNTQIWLHSVNLSIYLDCTSIIKYQCFVT